MLAPPVPVAPTPTQKAVAALNGAIAAAKAELLSFTPAAITPAAITPAAYATAAAVLDEVAAAYRSVRTPAEFAAAAAKASKGSTKRLAALVSTYWTRWQKDGGTSVGGAYYAIVKRLLAVSRARYNIGTLFSV